MMKQLIKANEIQNRVHKLNDEIVEVENFINLVINDELNIKVTAQILRPEKVDVEEKPENPFSSFGLGSFRYGSTEKTEEEVDFREVLNPSEVVVMFSRLLDLKKEYRKVLINEFKNLHLKLSIK